MAVLTGHLIPCIFDGRGYVPNRVSVVHRPLYDAVKSPTITVTGIGFDGEETVLLNAHTLSQQAGSSEDKWFADVIDLSATPVLGLYWSIGNSEYVKVLQEVKVTFVLPLEAEDNV